MANYQLPNDVVRTFVGAIGSMTGSGAAVPAPAGSSYTATSSDTTKLNAVVGGASGTDLTVNATGANTVGLTVTINEVGGPPETAFVWTLDTVSDVTPSAVSFNALAPTVTDVAQAVPPQA
jgi:hypothetical protein